MSYLHLMIDYLIIGQGLAGTFLSWNLRKQGKKVLVIDESRPFTASKVASGVINPVTGRRIVRSWMIETLMPFAVEAYSSLGKELDASLIRQCNILDFHPTPQMKMAFAERLPAEHEYLCLPDDENQWNRHFSYPFGFGEISPCWLVDIDTLLRKWREHLRAENSILEERFDVSQCEPGDHTVSYKNITASKIIFCDGAAGFDNPWFKLLPYAKNKGQALIVDVPGLPRDHIFKHGISIVPWRDGKFWVGSSYEWNFENDQPSEAFRAKTEEQLRHFVKHPFKVVDHIASERPANLERRPFAGLHPAIPTAGILNGLGTKGCTLAPFFASQLCNHFLYESPIEPAADVRRFSRILSR